MDFQKDPKKLASNSNFTILISLQHEEVKELYFKLKVYLNLQFKIEGLRRQGAKIYGLEDQNL